MSPRKRNRNKLQPEEGCDWLPNAHKFLPFYWHGQYEQVGHIAPSLAPRITIWLSLLNLLYFTTKCDTNKVLTRTCTLGMSSLTAFVTIQSLFEETQASLLDYKSGASITQFDSLQKPYVWMRAPRHKPHHELTTAAWASPAAFSSDLTERASRFNYELIKWLMFKLLNFGMFL